MTLLEKARLSPTGMRKSEVTDEEIELALAWIRDEVAFLSVQKALAVSHSGSAYLKLATGLRGAYRQGLLVWKEKKA